jgi:hypothetical protein
VRAIAGTDARAAASWFAEGGATVASKATLGARAAGAAALGRGMPAGGVGITCEGALVDTGGGAPDSRCPQCWQKANPTGVPLPHAGHVVLAGCAAGAAAAIAAAICAADGASTATVGANEGGAAAAGCVPDTPEIPVGGRCASDVPHILQKFMPGGLTVPHALHEGPAGAAALASGAASSLCPQS